MGGTNGGRPYDQGRPREACISIRVLDTDHDLIMDHAKRRGMIMSNHVRDVLVRLAKGEIKMDEPEQKRLL